MYESTSIAALQQKIRELEEENALLRNQMIVRSTGSAVQVPEHFKPLFAEAEAAVKQYFSDVRMDPTKGTIEISDERYVLVRASALSKDFLDSILSLYADRGETEAFGIGRNFLFDISHAIGMNDAKAFHEKMQLTDPISKLSAGTVHFAYAGWAFVDILPESNPTPDDNFYLVYNHPYSFEADAWKRAGALSKWPVCIMSAGYSSGWCEESFGIPLTAVEVSCTAQGHERCTFIMSPPHMIEKHVEKYQQAQVKRVPTAIPTFFQRKIVEEQMEKARILAEESSRAKSDFVANMSHEIRTPLNAIIGYSDLLYKTPLDPQQQQYLHAIQTSGNSLLAIINDIMDLSKLDARKIDIDCSAVFLPDLFRNVQTMLESKARSKGLQYRSHMDARLSFPVLGDSLRLTQILLNLIGNAIKFTEEGDIEIHCTIVEMTATQVKVQIRITDTGIGIAPENLAMIFERFTQADTTITRKYGGTGLGLAITRELVELHGGTISVNSAENKGTTFIIRLPFEKAAPAQIPAASRRPVSGHGHKHVLVVEDEAINRQLMAHMLKRNGYTVSVAGNGQEALQCLKNTKVDIVLMDLHMPGMDGYETTVEIRKTLQLDTPVVAFTAHVFGKEEDRYLEAGMNGYLTKPVREEDVIAVITQYTQPAVTDLGYLLQQTRGNHAFVMSLIHTFVQENPASIQALETAILDNNRDGMYKIAHTLRTSTGLFGLNETSDALLHIEQGGDNILEAFKKVKQTCAKAVEELRGITPEKLQKLTPSGETSAT
ncbi:ATP-binding protein [Chitinophaga cymbidii]|uniref:histidine kinase n=1 Tax=Chitinophaga cymbidii TaxID=1096750 RepID=A0A512RQN0_9BACT|nr:ATP-binding protein [Chitinophaga cymbidii]GEP97999.1 hypothetical protein CCY01nite_42590 [Chitinophaga cymbidii]